MLPNDHVMPSLYFYAVKADTYPIQYKKLLITTDLSELITKIIINNRATIVFFADGEKEVVKLSNEKTENYSIYTAVAYAIIKHIFGSNSHFQKTVDKKVCVQRPFSKSVKDDEQ